MNLYSATWCEPCKGLKQVLDSNDIKYTSIDVDKEPEKSQKAGIRALPTLELNGNILIGSNTLEQVREFMNENK